MTLPFAHDPVFSHREALLDPAFVASCLARHCEWATRITRVERVRVTYRIGDSLRVRHRFEADGREYHVAARAFGPGRSARAFAKALADGDTRDAAAPGVVHTPPVEAVFWIFPNDRRVATLKIIDAARESLSSRLARPWVESRLIAWAPENSATLQCLDAGRSVLAYAKVGAGARREYEQYLAIGDALAQTGADVRVPRPIAFSPAHDTMLIEAIAGRRLTYDPPDMRAIGVALAHLHGLPLTGLPAFERFRPASRRDAADLVVRSLPALAPAIERLEAELARRENGADQPGCLHGDIHAKNAIVSGARATLIDVEEMTWGARAADLGSLLARLRHARTLGDCSSAAADAGADALLDGYAGVSALPDAAAVRWHTAAALLVERVQRTVTRVYTRGLQVLDEQLAEATRLLISPGGPR